MNPQTPFNNGQPLSPSQVQTMRAQFGIQPAGSPSATASSSWAQFDSLTKPQAPATMNTSTPPTAQAPIESPYNPIDSYNKNVNKAADTVANTWSDAPAELGGNIKQMSKGFEGGMDINPFSKKSLDQAKNFGEGLLGLLGNSVKNVFAPVGAGVQIGADMISDNPVVQKIAQSPAGKPLEVIDKLNSWAEQHLEASNNLMNALNVIIGVAGDKAGGDQISSIKTTEGKVGDVSTPKANPSDTLRLQNEQSAVQIRNGKLLDAGDKTLSNKELNDLSLPKNEKSVVDLNSPKAEPVVAEPAVVSKPNQAIENSASTPKSSDAVGRIIQGKTEDIPAAERALKSLDKKGVKTYADLKTRIDSEIPKLAKQVDTEFSKNTKLLKMQQLAIEETVGKGADATEVSHNYVKDAVKQLKEYYTKTNDIKNLAKIKTLEAKLDPIKGKGITLKEVNDIARMHGKDLNGYNANGELASGLSRKAAENTRIGLKTTARQGLGGEAAKALDAKLSDLYDTQKLVDSMVEKVNAASQKTAKSNAFQKIVGGGVRAADLLTGNPLKAIGKEIGFKGENTMSPVELESQLQKNLRAIGGK